MDLEKIKELITLLEERPILTELEVKDGKTSIRLVRAMTGHIHTHVSQESTVPLQKGPIKNKELFHEAIHLTGERTSSPELPLHGHFVRSPMVGTMYTSSSPGTAPFVTVGQRVNVGDTLCIIEAMKMFNEIEADQSGKISSILVENGHAVEFEQPLFVIE